MIFKSEILREWAYAGFFFNFILAVSAHVNAGDGEFPGATVALALSITYYFRKRTFSGQEMKPRAV